MHIVKSLSEYFYPGTYQSWIRLKAESNWKMEYLTFKRENKRNGREAFVWKAWEELSSDDAAKVLFSICGDIHKFYLIVKASNWALYHFQSLIRGDTNQIFCVFLTSENSTKSRKLCLKSASTQLNIFNGKLNFLNFVWLIVDTY